MCYRDTTVICFSREILKYCVSQTTVLFNLYLWHFPPYWVVGHTIIYVSFETLLFLLYITGFNIVWDKRSLFWRKRNSHLREKESCLCMIFEALILNLLNFRPVVMIFFPVSLQTAFNYFSVSVSNIIHHEYKSIFCQTWLCACASTVWILNTMTPDYCLPMNPIKRQICVNWTGILEVCANWTSILEVCLKTKDIF